MLTVYRHPVGHTGEVRRNCAQTASLVMLETEDSSGEKNRQKSCFEKLSHFPLRAVREESSSHSHGFRRCSEPQWTELSQGDMAIRV